MLQCATTVGRHTARPHTVPLLYLVDADDVVVIASYGGRDYPPDWFLNLVAEPAVRVHMFQREWAGTAQVMEEPERAQWWPRFVAAYEGYTTYQGRTERVIPIIRIASQVAQQPADGERNRSGTP